MISVNDINQVSATDFYEWIEGSGWTLRLGWEQFFPGLIHLSRVDYYGAYVLACRETESAMLERFGPELRQLERTRINKLKRKVQLQEEQAHRLRKQRENQVRRHQRRIKQNRRKLEHQTLQSRGEKHNCSRPFLSNSLTHTKRNKGVHASTPTVWITRRPGNKTT